MVLASQNKYAENIKPQPKKKLTFFSKLQKQFSSIEDGYKQIKNNFTGLRDLIMVNFSTVVCSVFTFSEFISFG